MSSLKVAVRVRPFNAREIDMDALSIVEIEGSKTRLYKPRSENYTDFTFDYSYWSFNQKDSHFATQEQVYKDLGTDVVDCAFEGYNACVFAYGQTGSGKTFTMMGSRDNPGLIPRICEELFLRIKVGQESGLGYKTQASYLEIYNEQVKDLLGRHTRGQGLKIREHPNIGPYVDNLSQHAVSDFDEILECITRGNVQRTTASTNMNDTSSRSHAIFTITFVQAVFMNDMPSETVSKIHLVDLAGSERAVATGATGQRLKEGAHINKSLVTLGKVISLLAEQTNKSNSSKRVLYIPYRDSNLTWLLKDSLGGNSKTIMIAALSPADCNYSETLSTLRYANSAKNIINKPTINEDTNVKLIRELREEINKLKSMLSEDINSLTPSSKMLEDLLKKEAQEKVLTEEWTEKWKEAQSILQEQKSLGLRKSGVGVVLDSEMPHLILIHNDVTTGVTLYSLREGETLIGTVDCEVPQDIVLTGDGIQPQHCSIILRDGDVWLHPRPFSQCWLNASLIDQPTSISQGDIILLGRTNMFRFNNPAEAAKLRNNLSRSHVDISRLKLSTVLCKSCENIPADMDLRNSLTSTPNKRNKQYQPTTLTPRDDPELQDENRKILETIENALKQLNIERVQMYEQYKTKVRKLTDELRQLEKEDRDGSELLLCRERELLARKDMLTWEKNNEKVMVGIKITECTQLSDDLLLQAVESLDSAQFTKDTVKKNKHDIKKFEEQISDKEKILNVGTNKIAMIDEEIMQLDEELHVLNSQEKDKTEIKSKKSSMKLNLTKMTDSDVQTDQEELSKSDTYETCDTFHTISSVSPIRNDLPTSSSSSSNFPDKVLSSSSTIGNISESNCLAPSNPLMSDSGVCLESMRIPIVVTSPTNSRGRTRSVSDEDTASCSSCETGRTSDFTKSYCSMHALQRKIAAQKALIMKNLEMDADKSKLDAQIAQLQELQRRYVRMEKELCLSGRSHLECCNYEEIIYDEGNSSNVMTQSMETTSCIPSMTLSCPSMRDYPDEPDQLISIPSFVIRGAGKQTHYEYEIRIILPDGKLNILRRYSRFRELHLTMKHCYGSKIGALSFPRREIFSSNSESVAKYRRRLLELYIRRLIIVCARIPQSPIYDGPDGPGISRVTLANLSPFFKKGLFENGKHGTG